MPKSWEGDAGHRLPLRQVEPYRLWFEFLKQALRDPTIKVDRRIYQSWQIEPATKFDDWWSAHWRDLFALDIGVRELAPGEPIKEASKDAIIVRLPLAQDSKRTIGQVRTLLDERGAGRKLSKRRAGQFALSKGAEIRFVKVLNATRLMLRLYTYWLDFPDHGKKKRVEFAARRYCDWATAWNAKVRERKWKRPTAYLPEAFRLWIAYLDAKAKGGTKTAIGFGRSSNARGEGGNAEDARRQVARYILKARKIADNVARGEFPGKF